MRLKVHQSNVAFVAHLLSLHRARRQKLLSDMLWSLDSSLKSSGEAVGDIEKLLRITVDSGVDVL